MKPIGLIGGTGLEQPGFLTQDAIRESATPYGEPSAPILCGRIEGREVALLARHGPAHTIPPTRINNRANLHALKALGCECVLATAACGSLREGLGRGDFVIPDQFIDFTRRRELTFFDAFEPGVENARHTPMADPFDAELRAALVAGGRALGMRVHDGGTLLTIEGNRFSTRAESNLFRMWGADLVNMTVAPECILANELGLRYAAVAIVTDYDSWKTDEPPLRVADLVAVFRKSVDALARLLCTVLPKLPGR